MSDLVYGAVTFVFFALMIGYGYGCRALGRDNGSKSEDA